MEFREVREMSCKSRVVRDWGGTTLYYWIPSYNTRGLSVFKSY